jgi:hypothetical protein
MLRDLSRPSVRMRVLASRMRAHAAETSLEIFRRQFERAASELEEAAIDLESREEPRARRIG